LHLRQAVALMKASFSRGSQQRGQVQWKYQPDKSFERLKQNTVFGNLKRMSVQKKKEKFVSRLWDLS
jgi:hypothetical protein